MLIMLAMGIIFQMPAITYVLARIGLVTAGFLVRSWKVSLIVILIVAAVVSPTSDIPNMMLFAAPMIGLVRRFDLYRLDLWKEASDGSRSLNGVEDSSYLERVNSNQNRAFSHLEHLRITV